MEKVFTTADFADTRLSRPRDINCLRARLSAQDRNVIRRAK